MLEVLRLTLIMILISIATLICTIKTIIDGVWWELIFVIPTMMFIAYNIADDLDIEFERYSKDPEKRLGPPNIRPMTDLTNEPPLDLSSSSYENREATQKEVTNYFNKWNEP